MEPKNLDTEELHKLYKSIGIPSLAALGWKSFDRSTPAETRNASSTEKSIAEARQADRRKFNEFVKSMGKRSTLRP